MATIKRLPQADFTAIYKRVPRLTVEVIIMTSQGVILTKRSIEPAIGTWHIPGGTVFKNETLAAAVARVAEEELGARVVIERLAGTIEYPQFWNTDYGQPVGLAYLCRLAGGQIHGSPQGETVGYFKQLPNPMFPSQTIILEQLLSQAQLS